MHTIPRGQPAGSDTQLKMHIGGFAVSWARHTGVVEPSGARGQSAPRRAGSQVTTQTRPCPAGLYRGTQNAGPSHAESSKRRGDPTQLA
jgi:hypothetical protein